MKIGSSVWYCKKLATPDDNGNDYGAPIKVITAYHHFTVMPKNAYLGLENLGFSEESKLTAIAQPYDKWLGEFHKGDLFYCGVEPSTTEEYNGQKANYMVESVQEGNKAITITLKQVAN